MHISNGSSCPTCGRAFGPVVFVGGVIRQRLFDFVAAHREGVTINQVYEAIYSDDPDGGPKSRSVISVMVMQINKKIGAFGYRIHSTRGPAARYTLEELADEPVQQSGKAAVRQP